MDDRAGFIPPRPSRRDHAPAAMSYLIGDDGPGLFEDPDPHPAKPLPWPNYDHVDPIGSWRDRAACAGRFGNFPAVLCTTCPVRWWCLEYALRGDARDIKANGDNPRGGDNSLSEHGTWGGYTRAQRRNLLRAHGYDVEEALIAAYRQEHPRAE